MPIGISDFKKIIDGNYYFIDKTLLIKEIIDNKINVLLITRPRRCGKTINLSMLMRYFEITNEDNAYLFDGLKIDKEDENYKKHQGQYPVIFMSLKDIKYISWYDTFKKIKSIIQAEYDRFNYLMLSDALSKSEKKYFKHILEEKAEKVEYENSLEKLTLFIKKHYKINPIILIDEYDVPIQSGFINGFYNEINSFMKNWLSAGLKDNNCLNFAVFTGILQVSRESVFSDLNNIEVSTVLSENYSQYFGFTYEEVEQIALEYNRKEKLTEIKKWYESYTFGKTEIYNPWSIVNYFKNNCIPKSYWLNTGKDDIIYEFIRDADRDTKKDLKLLIEGKSIESIINDNVIYYEILKKRSNLYSFLVLTGYLKAIFKKQTGVLYIYNLKIPNKEILYTYHNEILNQISNEITFEKINEMLDFLLKGNVRSFENILKKLISSLLNKYNATEEFYNTFMLIIVTLFKNAYKIKYNIENTYEQFDLILIPRNKYSFGVIMKFNIAYRIQYIAAKSYSSLQQITNEYKAYFENTEVKEIYKYGIAFCDNQFEICEGQ